MNVSIVGLYIVTLQQVVIIRIAADTSKHIKEVRIKLLNYVYDTCILPFTKITSMLIWMHLVTLFVVMKSHPRDAYKQMSKTGMSPKRFCKT